jgi:hypothetical protein
MEEVIVNVDAEGNVKVEAKGVVGKRCATLTAAIEAAIGRTQADQKKPEFYRQEQAHVRAGGGRQS